MARTLSKILRKLVVLSLIASIPTGVLLRFGWGVLCGVLALQFIGFGVMADYEAGTLKENGRS